MAIFLSYEIGLSARFSSAKVHKIVDICKKNRNYFIDNQLFILNFSIDYINFLIVICICENCDDAEVQEKLDDNAQ